MTTALDLDVSVGAPELASPGSHLVGDELDRIVSTVCARYPDCPRPEAEALVSTAFAQLRAHARVTAHLIPLTLNRSLRLMREASRRAFDDANTAQCPPLTDRTH